MKKIKSGFSLLILLALSLGVSSCIYSSRPARYGYYDYRYLRPRPARVIVVRPAPRVVYRHYPPRYEKRNNARRSYQPRSNRTYRGNGNRSRSYGPR